VENDYQVVQLDIKDQDQSQYCFIKMNI